MNNEERIAQLENQVRELLAWKIDKMRQQISFPLDEASKAVIAKDLPLWNGVLAENGSDYTGAMCSLNGRILAFQVAAPSIYE